MITLSHSARQPCHFALPNDDQGMLPQRARHSAGEAFAIHRESATCRQLVGIGHPQDQ
jgi:hypothetical protein